MDSKSAGRKANLKQYRAVNGKWQFVPVASNSEVGSKIIAMTSSLVCVIVTN